MTDASDTGESSGRDRPSEGGDVIDASARTRPRVHAAETKGPEKIGELSFLSDVPLKLNMVLGEASMPLAEAIALEADSVVKLDKLSGEPVDIFVGNQKLGKGEVIVLHEKLRIRVLEITSPFGEEKGSQARGLGEKREE